MRCPVWLLVLPCGIACYRDPASHPCDGTMAPAYCETAPGASTTGGTSGPASAADTSSTSTSEQSAGEAQSSADDTSGAEDTSGTGALDTTDTSATDTTGTDAPEPFCGDGVVQPERNEECDGGDPSGDDGCSFTCKRDRFIFVTSPPYFRGGELFGLMGADNYCVSRASMAGLPNPLKYRAILSDSSTDAVERLYPGAGRYTLVDGTLIADTAIELFTVPLHHPIDLDELGQPAYVAAWTGTRHGTGRAAPGDVHCDDWANPDDLKLYGVFGWTDEIDATWIEADVTNCNAQRALYCLEQK